MRKEPQWIRLYVEEWKAKESRGEHEAFGEEDAGAILPAIGAERSLAGGVAAGVAPAGGDGETMPQDWESPERLSAPEGAPGYGSAEGAAAYALRPLSTGEVLDRTFAIYRGHFWLFAGLASLAGAFSLILSAVQLVVKHVVMLHEGIRIASLVTTFSGLPMFLLLLPVQAVVYAASVYALCEIYLGRGTAAKAALQATIGRWARYVGIALWQGWSAVWLFLVIFIPAIILLVVGAKSSPGMAVTGGLLMFIAGTGCLVYGVIAYIRNSLGVPAAVMEGTGVRASMRRSKTLAVGTKGRIFVVLLIAVALALVVGTIQSPMLFFIIRSPLEEHVLAQAAVLLIGFVGQTLVSPVALIGLTLVYFDQRVRMEAFDLVMMLGGSAPEPVATWSAAPVVAAASAVETQPVVSTERVEAGGEAGGSNGGSIGETMGSDGQAS
ncbi:MAG: hypothetical protein WB439_07045 [Acidobacteriaceae bacterium]